MTRWYVNPSCWGNNPCCKCHGRTPPCVACKNREQAETEAKRKAEEEAKRKAAEAAEAAEARRQAETVTAYIATGSGSEMKAWLLAKGFDEADVGHILLQFIKSEYGVKTLMEMFALEDADIDEILQGLPLAKRRALKKHIQLGV
jgi:D-serine deaminase-like pyridoxal phosphate-dependent protein